MLNRNDLERCGINYEQGMNRFMMNEEIFTKFLLKFKDDKCYFQLKDALEQSDCKEAFNAAHTLKGLAGNLAMDALASVTSDVTEALRAGELEKGRELMSHVDMRYNQMIEFLNNI